MTSDKGFVSHNLVFSTTPAVYAELSDKARSVLEGLILIQEDPEWQLLNLELSRKPSALAFVC